ncbi:ATP-binding protein [Sporocytophaga myxococcoides]|uniref:sensor histidine kinase n=1 Tax=Sporocytophaga myxococcoides TaxID=153721 RepID=UPI0004253A6A|nr:ATP-binding protein [Sporocytophaga myxococcoides]
MVSPFKSEYSPRLFTGFALSIGLIIVILVMYYRSSKNLTNNFSLVEHTYEVIGHLDAIEIKCRETENDVKGFLFQGDSTIILKFRQNSDFVEKELEELDLLIPDIGLQRRRFDEFSDLVEDKERLLENIINYKQSAEQLDLHKTLLKNVNEKFVAIRFIKKKMKDEEKVILNSRKNTAYKNLKDTDRIIIVAGVISILMGFIGIFAINKDIQRRRKIERNLTVLNENKNKFFSIISHDLRSPLNSIKGLTQILSEAKDKKSWKEADEVIDMLSLASSRASELLANLLEWSLSQMNKVVINKEYCDISSVANNICEIMEHTAQRKNIILNNKIEKGTIAFADKNMLETIFRNLISNSIKFTREGGVISLTSESFSKEVLLSVKDTGVGMSREMIDQILRIETRTSTKGTAKEEGTGLGLLICKDFIEKNGGRLEIKSIIGKGSVFSFSLKKFE